MPFVAQAPSLYSGKQAGSLRYGAGAANSTIASFSMLPRFRDL